MGAPRNPKSLGQVLKEGSIKDPDSGCWLWSRAVSSRGYGSVSYHGKQLSTHRASYETFIAPIPEGMSVLHRCDVRNCINPEHLFLGTYADNNSDRSAKGRSSRGESHHKAKLTEEQVVEIFHLGGSHRSIAKLYGVDHSLVGYIKTKKIWQHLNLSEA